MEKITITFQSGETKIEVSGIKGKTCHDVTRELEQELGTTTSDTKTREYYEQPVQNRNRQR